MRKFYLHSYDETESFDLNAEKALSADPTGLGNAFALSYKEHDKGKSLVNVTPDFEPITLNIYFNADGSSGYANYKNFMEFLAGCGTQRMLFEYDDGVTDKFCEVVLKSGDKTEIDEDGLFVQKFTFERQTYWYEKLEETFSLKSTDITRAQYPLPFPFGFVGRVMKRKQLISNKFFIDAPVTITISGSLKNNVKLTLSDLSGEVVSEISLSVNNEEGTAIVIEPTTKKITVTRDGETTNGYGLTDKTKQSFLYIPKGDYYLESNMDDNDLGTIEITVKRYLLD